MFNRFKLEFKAQFAGLKEAFVTIGLRRTCVVIWSRFVGSFFDWRYGLDTVKHLDLNELEISGKNKLHGVNYVPFGIPAFRDLLRAVPLPRNSGFVDYGCGKGRVLLLAADVGFQPVVGVDFASQLCNIARTNEVRYRARRPNLVEIEIIQADAAFYDPPADAGIFFFHCPFDEIVLSQAVNRIMESLRRNPREAWLIYSRPWYRRVLDEHPHFVVELEMIAGGYDLLVYRYKPGEKE